MCCGVSGFLDWENTEVTSRYNVAAPGPSSDEKDVKIDPAPMSDGTGSRFPSLGFLFFFGLLKVNKDEDGEFASLIDLLTGAMDFDRPIEVMSIEDFRVAAFDNVFRTASLFEDNSVLS